MAGSCRKLKVTLMHMCNTHNSICLRCILGLKKYCECAVIGHNQKHESKISSSIPLLYGAPSTDRSNLLDKRVDPGCGFRSGFIFPRRQLIFSFFLDPISCGCYIVEPYIDSLFPQEDDVLDLLAECEAEEREGKIFMGPNGKPVRGPKVSSLFS